MPVYYFLLDKHGVERQSLCGSEMTKKVNH